MSDARDLHFAADMRESRRIRADVRAAAATLGAAEDVCDVLALVVDELVNNAIEHGASYRKNQKDLRLRVSLVDQQLALDFYDPEMPEDQVLELGRAMRSAAEGLPSLESERGRGLFLISIYMVELRVDLAKSGGLHLHGRLAGG